MVLLLALLPLQFWVSYLPGGKGAFICPRFAGPRLRPPVLPKITKPPQCRLDVIISSSIAFFSFHINFKNIGGEGGRIKIIKGNENQRTHLQVLIKNGTITAAVSRLGYFIVTLSMVATSNDAAFSPLH